MNLLGMKNWVLAPLLYIRTRHQFWTQLCLCSAALFRCSEALRQTLGLAPGARGPAPGPLWLLFPLPGRTPTWLFLALGSQLRSQLLKVGFPWPFDLLVFGTYFHPYLSSHHMPCFTTSELLRCLLYPVWLLIYHVSPCMGKLHQSWLLLVSLTPVCPCQGECWPIGDPQQRHVR